MVLMYLVIIKYVPNVTYSSFCTCLYLSGSKVLSCFNCFHFFKYMLFAFWFLWFFWQSFGNWLPKVRLAWRWDCAYTYFCDFNTVYAPVLHCHLVSFVTLTVCKVVKFVFKLAQIMELLSTYLRYLVCVRMFLLFLRKVHTWKEVSILIAGKWWLSHKCALGLSRMLLKNNKISVIRRSIVWNIQFCCLYSCNFRRGI